jgi:RNA-directed DNA polymerase
MRLLGIPTIEDRIAQMLVRRRLEPLVELVFLPDSYGYRPGKSALDAVGKARERCWKLSWVVEFDIKGLFDNIDHEMLMKAVWTHTQEKWIILYTERFLKAPIVLPDGTNQERIAGTPQGGVISPVLANLFMHYAFDRWMEREFPSCPWERYADDALIHCATLKQAQYVLSRLDKRMRQCLLELHPDKTRIVYCRSQRNKGRYENESFDFLGYTFKTRWCKDKGGNLQEVFTPAVSKNATKSFREKVRAVCKGSSNWSIEELATKLNPIVRGWCNYFGAYRKSEIQKELYYTNYAIALWYRRNHKRMKGSLHRTWGYLANKAKHEPTLFAHWLMGKVPTILMTRAV